MLNNYFNDMAVAIVAVAGFTIFLLVGIVQKKDRDTKVMILSLFPKMAGLMIGTVVFVLGTGFIRLSNFRAFELANAVENGKEAALVVKYIIMSVLFLGGVLCWLLTHRKIKMIRKEK